MRALISLPGIFLLALLLAACGGSSDGPAKRSKVGSDEVLAGVFVDSPVENLGYRTISPNGAIRGGHTDKDGRFLFREGDRITFYIGKLELRSGRADYGKISGLAFPELELSGANFPRLASGTAGIAMFEQSDTVLVISPLDFSKDRSFDDRIVINIARLLQSLDYDGDPNRRRQAKVEADRSAPGIFISELAHELAKGADVNLNTNHIDVKVAYYVDSAGKDRRYREDKTDWHYMVSEGQAITHLRATLDRVELEYFGPEVEALSFPGNEPLRSCVKHSAEQNSIRYVWDLKEINCPRMGLSSLNGIDQLINLERINLYGNSIRDIDVSGLEKLVWLDLGFNQISELDLSESSMLEAVFAESNSLTRITLPVSGNLSTLILSNNHLGAIDVSGLSQLHQLSLYNNQIESIDLSSNEQLRRVFLGRNQLTSLDLTGNPVLKEVGVSDNSLEELVLNLSSPPETIRLWRNNLSLDALRYILDAGIGEVLVDTDMDAVNDAEDNCLGLANPSQFDGDRDGTGDACTAVADLYIEDPALAACALEAAGSLMAYQLIELDCSGFGITRANEIQAFISLRSLNLRSNALTGLSLGSLPELEQLDLSFNSLKGVDLGGNRKLRDLALDYNNLLVLDLSNNSSLETLSVSHNSLRQMDLKHLPILRSVDVSSNQLTTISLEHNRMLESLAIEDNPLTSATREYLQGIDGITLSY